MGDFKIYSPDLVIATIGALIVNGYANDTFLEVERDEDGFMKYTGSLGDVARSKNLNRGGSVTFTLMASAPVNDFLSDLAVDDELIGIGFFPLQIKDLSGNLMVNSEISWIKKWPKIDRAKESGTVQWVIDCADLLIYAGGNVIPL